MLALLGIKHVKDINLSLALTSDGPPASKDTVPAAAMKLEAPENIVCGTITQGFSVGS